MARSSPRARLSRLTATIRRRRHPSRGGVALSVRLSAAPEPRSKTDHSSPGIDRTAEQHRCVGMGQRVREPARQSICPESHGLARWPTVLPAHVKRRVGELAKGADPDRQIGATALRGHQAKLLTSRVRLHLQPVYSAWRLDACLKFGEDRSQIERGGGSCPPWCRCGHRSGIAAPKDGKLCQRLFHSVRSCDLP